MRGPSTIAVAALIFCLPISYGLSQRGKITTLNKDLSEKEPKVVPLLGIKVSTEKVPRDLWSIQDRHGPVARIVAVREGGSAYLAGVTPGDLILRADGKARDADSLLEHLSSFSTSPNRPPEIELEISYQIYLREPDGRINGPHSSTPESLMVTLTSDGAGAWTEHHPSKFRYEQQQPLAERVSLVKLRKAEREYFDRYKNRLHVVPDPCAPDPARVAEIVALFLKLAHAAGHGGETSDSIEYQLRRFVYRVACENQRKGVLPDELATLLAISSKRLNPCKVWGPEEVEKDLQEVRFRTGYSLFNTRAHLWLSRYVQDADEASRACFLELVKGMIFNVPDR